MVIRQEDWFQLVDLRGVNNILFKFQAVKFLCWHMTHPGAYLRTLCLALPITVI